MSIFSIASSSNLDNTFNLIKMIVVLLTACGVFVVGIHLMTKGFVNLSKNNKSLFLKMFKARNRFGGIGAGILHSGLAQSSDATAVYAVRLADVGAITLFSACCVVVGSNIGTNVTSFFVSLSEFNITPYFAFLTFVGALPLLAGKGKAKIFGEICSGFGIMFVGIQLLELSSQDPLFIESFEKIIEIIGNKYLLLLIGVTITCVVQSSSVMTAVVIFSVGSGVLPLESGFYIVVGANIGTCVTSFIASMKLSLNAKRASLFRLIFNLFGAIIFLIVMAFASNYVMDFANHVSQEFVVALFGLTFNVVTAILILPLIRPFVALCRKIIQNKTEESL